MHYKTCEICGIRSGRSDGQKRIFMARFPLNEDRCKKWVKATGKEDLVYVPIEKLHQLKHICGRHFLSKDFKKKKTQLRKKAVPSVELSAEPLADELFIGFPLHIVKTTEFTSIISKEHDYSGSSPTTFTPSTTEPMVGISRKREICLTTAPSTSTTPIIEVSKKRKICFDTVPDPLYMKCIEAVKKSSPCPEPTAAESLLNQIHDKNKDKIENNVLSADNDSFAMEQDDFDDAIEIKSEDDIVKDDDVEFIEELRLKNETRVHADFKCNVCRGDIVGFRYTCVQCPDWDMCASCEARGEHPAHYVLRLPAPKPYAECEPVIAAIREQISYLLLLRKEIKSEVYVNEDTSIDLVTEVFDPNLTDPFSASNDRTVPELTMHQESATGVNTADLVEEVTSAAESYMDSPSPSLQQIFMHQESATVENITDLMKEETSAESNMDSPSPGVKQIVARYKTPDFPVKRFYIIGAKSRSNSKKYVVKEFTNRTIQAATKTHSNVHKVK